RTRPGRARRIREGAPALVALAYEREDAPGGVPWDVHVDDLAAVDELAVPDVEHLRRPRAPEPGDVPVDVPLPDRSARDLGGPGRLARRARIERAADEQRPEADPQVLGQRGARRIAPAEEDLLRDDEAPAGRDREVERDGRVPRTEDDRRVRAAARVDDARLE